MVVTQEHPADSVAAITHGLIAVPRGAVVRLVDGDPITGLPPPYADYVMVEFGGKKGRVSKYVVRRRGAAVGKSARSLVPHDAVLE